MVATSTNKPRAKPVSICRLQNRVKRLVDLKNILVDQGVKTMSCISQCHDKIARLEWEKTYIARSAVKAFLVKEKEKQDLTIHMKALLELKDQQIEELKLRSSQRKRGHKQIIETWSGSTTCSTGHPVSPRTKAAARSPLPMKLPVYHMLEYSKFEMEADTLSGFTPLELPDAQTSDAPATRANEHAHIPSPPPSHTRRFMGSALISPPSLRRASLMTCALADLQRQESDVTVSRTPPRSHTICSANSTVIYDSEDDV
jgi:hypothetical protein